MMAGGEELESLAQELEKTMGADSALAQDLKADIT
jgi:simple sugar transport system ATP-binding protein